jgi:hypothetical protein
MKDAVREVLVLMHSELNQHDVSLETALCSGHEPIIGDRVQLRRGTAPLIMNRDKAMTAACASHGCRGSLAGDFSS